MPASNQAPVFVSSDAARTVFRWKDAITALQQAYGLPIPVKATPPRTVAILEKPGCAPSRLSHLEVDTSAPN